MKRKHRSVVLIFSLALVCVLVGSSLAAAQTTALVYLRPASRTIELGKSTRIEVWVNNVTNFYGVQFVLGFNNAYLKGVSIAEGAAFTDHPGEYMVAQRSVGSNTMRFAASLLRVSKAPPLDGNLHLATLTFKGIGAGVSPLTWNSVMLSDEHGQPIPFTTQAGAITVIDRTRVTGQAFMEGRTNHGGIDVNLDGSAFNQITMTYVDGWYAFNNVPMGTYTVTVSHRLYLTTQLQDCPVNTGETVYMPEVTLLGGDLNNDGVIDILDLSLCAAHFNQAYPGVDINDDGLVDLYDLVLIGKNFNLYGPRIQMCTP